MFAKGKDEFAFWLILGLTFLLRAYGLPTEDWWPALVAVGSGYLLYQIAKNLWGANEALAAALFLAVTPWAIIAARSLWLENLILLAVLFSLWRWVETKRKSIFFLGASLLLLFLPLGFVFLQGQALTIDRAMIEEINRFRGWNWQTSFPWTGAIFANKATFYIYELARRYLSYFDPSFLFFRGVFDIQFGIPDRGVLFLVSLPLLLAGAARVYAEKSLHFIFLILVLAPLPAAFSATPLNTRAALLLLVPLLLLASSGLGSFFSRFKPRTVWLILVLILAIELTGFWHDQTYHFLP